jgi:hypothetical protein
MNNSIKYGLVLLLSGCFAGTTLAQTFTIKKTEQSPEGLILYYDLVDDDKSRTYLIQVYSSHDNFKAPVQKISGDVGINVKPGLNKKITWNARRELGNAFAGDVQLEVRGRLYVPTIRITSTTEDIIKRTRSVPISWTSETKGGKLRVSLYQDDQVVKVYTGINNSGKTKIKIPASVVPGTGYCFSLTLESTPEDFAKTNEFEVKKRFSTLAKIAPVAIVAGVIFILLPDKASSEVEGPPGLPDGKN